jgi:hypothetical protein
MLTQKGFNSGFQPVSVGQTRICTNGEVGPYFRNKRGVRQGDLISPLLYNFIVDALAAILDAATRASYVLGVIPCLIPSGVTLLQYAGDTVFLF